jgi:hypothetical protein
VNRLLDLPTNGHTNGHATTTPTPTAPTPARPVPPPSAPLHLPKIPPRTTLPDAALPLLIETHLHKLLGSLPPAWPVEPVRIEATVYGTSIVCQIGPTGLVPIATVEVEEGLNVRETRILNMVRAEVDRLGRRVIGRELIAALHAAGYRVGKSTMNEVLSDLVHRKYLINPKDKLGYGFPGEHDNDNPFATAGRDE